jgi:type III secretion protein N (ATPase)
MHAHELAVAIDRALSRPVPLELRPRVTEAVGTVIKVAGLTARVGELCGLRSPGTEEILFAEVVGFAHQTALLIPFGYIRGVSSDTQVVATGQAHCIEVGEALRGRVLDGFGVAIDGKGPVGNAQRVPVYAESPPALERRVIEDAYETGVRVIDALLSVGEGQRMGVFSAAGAGKSTLLGMLANAGNADVNVIALIGERGREVREFIERILGPAGLEKSVVVVATSDRSAVERAKAAYVAATIAEHFREQGARVLLLLDSVTRFARALREIGLASGEPPTRRGFPPSIFAALPQLFERAGQSAQGSITAFYSILTEGEELDDPIAEEVKSILDGHIVLARKLAAVGHYPAVEPLTSISRVMGAVVPIEHLNAANKLRSLLAKYDEIELLLKLGEYQAGADALADEAIAKRERIVAFLRQPLGETTLWGTTRARLLSLAEA